MKKVTDLKSRSKLLNYHYLYIVFILLFTGSMQAQVCSPSPNSALSREIHESFYNSNATEWSTSTVTESMGGPNYTVYINTLTIPYFEYQLQTDLRFKNSVLDCTWNNTSSPCGSKEIKVYNSHSGGTVIGSAPNQVDIYSHNFSVGTNNIRVEASCGGQVYQTRYYRYIVQKEPTPSTSMDISAYCQKNHEGKYSGYLGFKVSGSHSNADKLYLRVVPPSGSSCSTTDYQVSSLVTGPTPSSFYSCNTNGTYTIKLVYKSSLLGGGYTTHVLNHNYYSYSKTFRTCMNMYEVVLLPRILSEENSPGASIYPNPATNEIQLEYLAKNENAEIYINDMNSNPVKALSLDGQKKTTSIDISSLKEGLYFITIVDGNKTLVKRFVKK